MEVYIGYVEDVVDPDNLSRVKVRILPFYKDIELVDIPYASVMRSADLSLTGGNGLNIHNLKIGTQVVCIFLDNNQQKPLVLGSIPGKDDINTNSISDEIVFNTDKPISINTPTFKINGNQENNGLSSINGAQTATVYTGLQVLFFTNGILTGVE